MKRDGEFPAVGESATTLGVRLPGDLEADESGNVSPGAGGMSVSPSIGALPRRFVPRRLQHLARGATGNDRHHVWSLGSGPFVEADMTPLLMLRPDPENSDHGFIEPLRVMHQDAYIDAIHATREDWHVDE